MHSLRYIPREVTWRLLRIGALHSEWLQGAWREQEYKPARAPASSDPLPAPADSQLVLLCSSVYKIHLTALQAAGPCYWIWDFAGIALWILYPDPLQNYCRLSPAVLQTGKMLLGTEFHFGLSNDSAWSCNVYLAIGKVASGLICFPVKSQSLKCYYPLELLKMRGNAS